jgi:hypothetical protein
VVVWANGEPPIVVAIDTLVPREEVEWSLHQLDVAEFDVPVAHVQWHRVSKRAWVQILYDTLDAHGIPVHPSRAEALTGWDDLHCTALSVPAHDPLPREEHHNLALMNAVTSVQSLDHLITRDPKEQMLSHPHVVVHILGFPRALYEECHGAMGMDMRERLAKVSPEAIVRAYEYDGVTVPLLLWYRAMQSRVVAMVQPTSDAPVHASCHQSTCTSCTPTFPRFGCGSQGVPRACGEALHPFLPRAPRDAHQSGGPAVSQRGHLPQLEWDPPPPVSRGTEQHTGAVCGPAPHDV